MCFSAQASFAAAGALSIVSLLSIKHVRTKKLIPLALMPLFFGIQQASEGFVWITLNNGDTTSMLHVVSMYSFLFFAGMFWPTWIPIALYVVESSPPRKLIIKSLVLDGIIVSIVLLYCWILQTTGAQIINHHIDYPVTNYPFGITDSIIARLISYLIAIFYGTCTIGPFFVSSLPHMKILGTAAGIGALIAYIFYLVAFSSVWCFFVAICSILVYFVVRK